MRQLPQQERGQKCLLYKLPKKPSKTKALSLSFSCSLFLFPASCSSSMAANPPKPWKAEYAKSGRSSCKSCKSPIDKEQLRLGKMVAATQFDGFMPVSTPSLPFVFDFLVFVFIFR